MKINVDEYKEFVRGLPCLVCGRDGSDPHHLVAIGMGSNRKNATYKDFVLIPLQREYHVELHTIGYKTFEKKYKINLFYESVLVLAKFIAKEKE